MYMELNHFLARPPSRLKHHVGPGFLEWSLNWPLHWPFCFFPRHLDACLNTDATLTALKPKSDLPLICPKPPTVPVVGRTVAPKDVYILIARTHEYAVLYDKGELTLQMELRLLLSSPYERDIILGYPVVPM